MNDSNFQVRPPKHCADMRMVRAEIDRIDQEMVRLLAERQGYIERAAELKENRDDVRDEARIADVLTKVNAQARRAGLDQNIVEPVFRVLVECSIALEFKAFDRRNRPENP